MKLFKTIAILVTPFLFFSCFNEQLEGTYIGDENAFFNQLTFKSNKKVELIFMGTTSEADYSLENKKVKIINAGQNQILIITDKGCLDGGGFIGTYCKE